MEQAPLPTQVVAATIPMTMALPVRVPSAQRAPPTTTKTAMPIQTFQVFPMQASDDFSMV